MKIAFHLAQEKKSDYRDFKEFKEAPALLSAVLELHVLLKDTSKVKRTGESVCACTVHWGVLRRVC